MKGYIYRGFTGWTMAIWDGYDTDFYFGFSTWDEALKALRVSWLG